MRARIAPGLMALTALVLLLEAVWSWAVATSELLPYEAAHARLEQLDRWHPFRDDARNTMADRQWQVVVNTGNIAMAELAYDTMRERVQHSADPRWTARAAWLAVVLHNDLNPATDENSL